MPKLTPQQVEEVHGEMVTNGIPCRFLIDGCNLNIVTGHQMRRGVNVIHQVVYWNFTEETARKIAEWLGAKVVFSKGSENADSRNRTE